MMTLFQHRNQVSGQEDAPSKAVIYSGGEGIDTGQLLKRGNAFAQLIKDAGCQRGDHFCVIMNKSIDYLISLIGINQAGGIVMSMDANSLENQWQNVISGNLFKWIITDESGTNFLKSEASFNWSFNIGWMGKLQALPDRIQPEFIRDNLEQYQMALPSLQFEPNGFTALFCLDNQENSSDMYLLSNYEISEFVNQIMQSIPLESENRIVGFLPTQSIPFMVEIGISAFSNSSVQLNKPGEMNNLDTFLGRIRKFEATHVFCSTKDISPLINGQLESSEALLSVRELLLWGPPLSMFKLYLLKKLFPNCSIHNYYIITGEGKEKNKRFRTGSFSTYMDSGYQEESVYIFKRSYFNSSPGSFKDLPRINEVHHACWKKRNNGSSRYDLKEVSNKNT